MTKPPHPPRTVHAAIAIVLRGDAVLICRRPDHVDLPGYWEFPGGKIEPGETAEAAAIRELAEETGLSAIPVARLPTIDHTYAHATVHLVPVLCRAPSGTPRPLASTICHWADRQTLTSYGFPPANTPLLKILESLPPSFRAF